jgi:hypothetical protein
VCIRSSFYSASTNGSGILPEKIWKHTVLFWINNTILLLERTWSKKPVTFKELAYIRINWMRHSLILTIENILSDSLFLLSLGWRQNTMKKIHSRLKGSHINSLNSSRSDVLTFYLGEDPVSYANLHLEILYHIRNMHVSINHHQ